jgi:hypothetical protein
MIVTRRWGSPSRSAIATEATASVGETMAPRVKASDHGKPGSAACATTPTASVVAKTRPTARSTIGRRLARKSRQEVSHASP